jgi:hypothetical protein
LRIPIPFKPLPWISPRPKAWRWAGLAENPAPPRA